MNANKEQREDYLMEKHWKRFFAGSASFLFAEIVLFFYCLGHPTLSGPWGRYLSYIFLSGVMICFVLGTVCVIVYLHDKCLYWGYAFVGAAVLAFTEGVLYVAAINNLVKEVMTMLLSVVILTAAMVCFILGRILRREYNARKKNSKVADQKED